MGRLSVLPALDSKMLRFLVNLENGTDTAITVDFKEAVVELVRFRIFAALPNGRKHFFISVERYFAVAKMPAIFGTGSEKSGGRFL